ncbi:MAG: GH32 C-terminal domain-containing protein [Firmicutes bacterium]|nr:GH32 C-terminal domain-containing protein [Bacillota bacterium]
MVDSENSITTDLRPRLHFTAPENWINDPNGLIYYGGVYHLFYQHNPKATHWGPMHWGHATTTDGLHFIHQPIALAPSQAYDADTEGGCFSGTAVEDAGLLKVVYTGSTYQDGHLRQVQCLATSADGVHFDKYDRNPVLEGQPPGCTEHFRDPKVWRHEDAWYMLLGTQIDDQGAVVLYKSAHLTDWVYIGIAAQSDGSQGSMWECPDFFSMDGKDVLMFSPIGLPDRQTTYLIGHLDYTSGAFTAEITGQVDYGLDFYAPQTLEDSAGRRVVVAWMNGWDWMPWFRGYGPVQAQGWCGCMSLPRVLTLGADKHLRFAPVETLRANRKPVLTVDPAMTRTLVPNELCSVPAPTMGTFEVVVSYAIGQGDAQEVGLRLSLADSADPVLIFAFSTTLQALQLLRVHSETDRVLRTIPYVPTDVHLTFRLVIDVSTVELFVDDGVVTMSCVLPGVVNRHAVDLYSVGGRVTVASLEVYDLA